MSKRTKKMTVFERLKSREVFSEVRKEEGSGSTVYEGLRMYMDWAETQIGEFHSQLTDLEHGIVEKGEEHAKVLTKIEECVRREDELVKQVDARSGELEALKVWIAEERSDFTELNRALADIRGKGLTDEAISRIGRIDFGEGGELLERISTVERHQELLRSNGILEVESQDKMNNIRHLQRERKSLTEEIDSARNALDDVQLRRRLHDEANVVVQGFLQEDYDVDLLLSLLKPLEALSVKGQPNTSVQRLIEGLSGYRRLTELQEECYKKEIELARLTKELVRTEATLIVMKDTVLEEIEESMKASIKNMNEQASTAMKQTTDLKDLFENNLRDLTNAHTQNMDQVKTTAVAHVGKVSGSARDEIQRASTSLNGYIKVYQKAAIDWGETKEKQGRLMEFIKYGEIIHDIYEKKTAAREIPLEIIVRLAHVVFFWVHNHIPDAVTSPDEATRRIEGNLIFLREYKILALMDMVTKYFSVRARGVT